jgi:hypothetical protein
VLLIWTLERVPSRQPADMAGIKNDITPGLQRLALQGFVNIPYFWFMLGVSKTDGQASAYFIRAYDYDVLTQFAESVGKRSFSSMGRPAKDN